MRLLVAHLHSPLVTAVGPPLAAGVDVVDVAVAAGDAAAFVAAGSVADDDGFSDGAVEVVDVLAEVDDLAVGAEHDSADGAGEAE